MFTARSFDTILADMIAYVQARTDISDFSVGSVIRTILEAAALEDDEQYFQMVQLLDLFAITTAAAEALDRRMADFGLVRLSPKASTGTVRFFDSNLITEQLAIDAVAAATTLTVFDSSEFPTSGFPYTIRVGEGVSRVFDTAVTANSTTTNTLTLGSGLPVNIFVGDRVSLVTGATSKTISLGTDVHAPATVAETARVYATQETAYILAGNYYSNEVIARASASGTFGNVGTGRVSQFASSAPFSGAGVTNTEAMAGGTNRESDEDFRARGLEALQSLSRGTPLAVKSAAIGVEDPVTGQRVVSANLVEDFDADEVIVYVDDGSGLDPSTVILSADSLNGAVVIGGTSLVLADASDFPTSGTVLIEAEGVNSFELVSYNNKSSNTLLLSTALVSNHANTALVNVVDAVTASSENGQRRFSLLNYPIVRSAERIWKSSGSTWVLLVRGTDYTLNKGTGEFIITDLGGLSTGTKVAAHYTYYTNLIAEVQKVLEGDVDDPVAYPGVKAAGVFLSVEAPVIKRITVTATITARSGFSEAALAPQIKRAIEAYITSRKIGEDLIKTRMIDVAFNVNGLEDISITAPTGNIVVLESELPVPYDSDGDSLVTVS